MSTIEIKDNFHKLIDRIENEALLTKFYDILQKANETPPGALWDSLSREDQEELLKIDKETDDENNLISHAQVTNKHKKWL